MQGQAGRTDTSAGFTVGGWGKSGLPIVWELTSADPCQADNPGEGYGYTRLENAWQAIVKDWDMAEHACVQAPRHACT